MAVTPIELFRGAATTTPTTVLSTVPAATTYVVTEIVIVNTAAAQATATISCGPSGAQVVLVPTVTIPANSFIVVQIRQVLTTTQTLTGGASATTVNFHISGTAAA
jgi:hypothetical protein